MRSNNYEWFNCFVFVLKGGFLVCMFVFDRLLINLNLGWICVYKISDLVRIFYSWNYDYFRGIV